MSPRRRPAATKLLPARRGERSEVEPRRKRRSRGEERVTDKRNDRESEEECGPSECGGLPPPWKNRDRGHDAQRDQPPPIPLHVQQRQDKQQSGTRAEAEENALAENRPV